MSQIVSVVDEVPELDFLAGEYDGTLAHSPVISGSVIITLIPGVGDSIIIVDQAGALVSGDPIVTSGTIDYDTGTINIVTTEVVDAYSVYATYDYLSPNDPEQEQEGETSMSQLGSYAKGELEYVIEHDGVVLTEIQDMKWDVDVPKVATGSGLGDLKNKRFKRTGPTKGTWSMSRNMLSKAEKGELFLGLIAGAEYVIQENIATSSATFTPAQTPLVSILEIRLSTSGTVLEEGVDYSVNYLTGIITFAATTTEAATIKYTTTTANQIGSNLIQNGGFEADITNIWEAISCTLARSTTTPYVGSYKAALTSINATSDGLKYLPDTAVVPNRTYRFSFYAKAAAADDCSVTFTDADGAVAMTAVGTAATFSTSWKLHEFTFTPDKATILSIEILNSDSSPGATLDVDQVRLAENAPSVNPMTGGSAYGFSFNVIIRRKDDGVQVGKLVRCEVFKDGFASGDMYKEDISGEFLGLLGE